MFKGVAEEFYGDMVKGAVDIERASPHSAGISYRRE